jgi:hypothetical protein
MKRTYILAHDIARANAVRDVQQAPEGWMVTITPPRRTSDQNAIFHALCGDIGRTKLVWSGKPRDSGDWKLLLVSGHAVATKHEAEIVNGLEGELVNLRESTAQMSKARGASLIDYTLAFCANTGIDTTLHSRGMATQRRTA